MEKNKIIDTFEFKGKTPAGGICKTRVYVRSNGTTHVNQFFLVDEDKPLREPAIKIYTKMKKSIFVVAFGLKYTSLFAIFNGVSYVLEANKIQEKDII